MKLGRGDRLARNGEGTSNPSRTMRYFKREHDVVDDGLISKKRRRSGSFKKSSAKPIEFGFFILLLIFLIYVVIPNLNEGSDIGGSTSNYGISMDSSR